MRLFRLTYLILVNVTKEKCIAAITVVCFMTNGNGRVEKAVASGTLLRDLRGQFVAFVNINE